MIRILKKGCIVLLCLLLSACSSFDTEDELYTNIENNLFSLAQNTEIAKPNMYKEYYDYFLPFDMKNIKSSILSEQFRVGNEILVMNFRTISFIKKVYYSQDENEDEIVENYTEEELQEMMENGSVILDEEEQDSIEEVAKEYDYSVKRSKVNRSYLFQGNCLGKKNQNYPYNLSMLVDGNMCYLYLDAQIATFTCYVPVVSCDDMIERMFTILKSIEYNELEIIKDYKLLYSLLSMEEKDNKQEIYDESIPDNGYLEDLLHRQED